MSDVVGDKVGCEWRTTSAVTKIRFWRTRLKSTYPLIISELFNQFLLIL